MTKEAKNENVSGVIKTFLVSTRASAFALIAKVRRVIKKTYMALKNTVFKW